MLVVVVVESGRDEMMGAGKRICTRTLKEFVMRGNGRLDRPSDWPAGRWAFLIGRGDAMTTRLGPFGARGTKKLGPGDEGGVGGRAVVVVVVVVRLRSFL